ncbi:isocitrate lyase/phosphoenolpyruvate mutase family protein [Cupriavidus basilensis]
MHIEDQVGAKRCGHRPGKEIVSQGRDGDRIKAAVDARTDARISSSWHAPTRWPWKASTRAIERAVACVEAGADAIFPEAAMTDLAMYRKFVDAVKVPVLANITEFGADAAVHHAENWRSAGVSMVLYPLSAFRAMNKAAENVYAAIRRDGTQQNVVDTMQTRAELYESIGYHDFEQKLDALFAQGKGQVSTTAQQYDRKQDQSAQHSQGDFPSSEAQNRSPPRSRRNPSPCRA